MHGLIALPLALLNCVLRGERIEELAGLVLPTIIQCLILINHLNIIAV